MWKRRLVGFILASCVALSATVVHADEPEMRTYGNADVSVTWSEADPCAVEVVWKGTGDPDVRVRVTKDGGASYTYRLADTGGEARVTFTDGSGNYGIEVFQHGSGNRYKSIYSMRLDVESGSGAFLGSSAMVPWDEDSSFLAGMDEILDGCATDFDKIAAVYGYLTENMSYDQSKADAVRRGAWDGGCVPGIEDTWETGMGVCYDIAGLMTAMLRSCGVPCVLAYGWADGSYHAWVAVCPDESGFAGSMWLTEDEWCILDPTFGMTNERLVRRYVADDKYEAEFLY